MVEELVVPIRVRVLSVSGSLRVTRVLVKGLYLLATRL